MTTRTANTAPYGTRLPALLPALLLAAASLAPFAAQADRVAVPMRKVYQQECAACHLAYPPGLLPAASWQRLMGNLPKHFGTDASLDAATLQTLSTASRTFPRMFSNVVSSTDPVTGT